MNPQNLKISTLLTLGFTALLGVVALVAGFGLLQVSKTNQSIDTLYRERVIPLQQLNTIADMYTLNIMDGANKMSVGNLDGAAALKLFDQGQEEITARWQTYTATARTDAEKTAVAVARQVASGDLTQHIARWGPEEVANLLGALQDMQDSLVTVVSTVRNGSEGVATASAEIAQGNQNLSERTESQASSLEETAASMVELNAAVHHNADSAIRRVTDIMGEISAASSEQSAGVAQVGDAVSHMDQVTQQNAALVEQMAAAASSLKALADEQVQAVSVFHLPATGHRTLRLA